MKGKLVTSVAALALFAAPTIPGRAAAHGQGGQQYPYVLVDLGTLGGPQSGFNAPGVMLTDQGVVIGWADTPTTDTDFPNFNPFVGQDRFVEHPFVWHRGVMTDLGALPGNTSAAQFVLNAQGDAAGESEYGPIDPLEGFPELRAVLWQGRNLLNLGTLGGQESVGWSINNQDQVVGWAANAIPDPWTLQGFGLSWGTQMHAFLWQHGVMHDLGTLGGPDSQAEVINDRGQVAGASFTTATANAGTGLPTEDPFLWQNGHMQDLGGFGGTIGYPTNQGSGVGLNASGEVVGASDLPGDQLFHPFLWNGHSLQDLGTFGGNYGLAATLNQAGDVVGWATIPGDMVGQAFLWKNGVLTDLDGAGSTACSYANSVNAWDQVVGGSCGANPDGWLWQHGTLSDLNSLVAPSNVQLTEAHYINDRGEIAVTGVLANGNQHVVLLIPRDEAASEGVTSNVPALSTNASIPTLHGTPLACLTAPLWKTQKVHGCAGDSRRA